MFDSSYQSLPHEILQNVKAVVELYEAKSKMKVDVLPGRIFERCWQQCFRGKCVCAF